MRMSSSEQRPSTEEGAECREQGLGKCCHQKSLIVVDFPDTPVTPHNLELWIVIFCQKFNSKDL